MSEKKRRKKPEAAPPPEEKPLPETRKETPPVIAASPITPEENPAECVFVMTPKRALDDDRVLRGEIPPPVVPGKEETHDGRREFASRWRNNIHKLRPDEPIR